MKTIYYRILFVAIVATMLSALPAVAQNEQITKNVTKGVADSVALQRTSISFGDEVLLHDMDLSIEALDSTSVPELDYGMFNVSVEGEGFRFLPHGTHFGGDGATVKLGYDRTRIPSGYTEDDIRTYYYDTDKKNWVALQLVEVDKQQACVISRTTHFTDMINGVIVAPESPETSAFTPTMMNDIKAADPTSKINIIAPPTANNRGSANLQYPFEMPPARNGMQPQVALSYNSDGGSGWAGEGWDISIPSITVDTRWGVPRYNTNFETETYLLNGQMLAMMNGNEMTVAHRSDSVLRQENRQFFMRQGGDFNLIVRKGNNPSNYYWEVTDRNGVKYTYGGNENARLRGLFTDVNGNQRQVIAEWKLTRIEEPHGDFMVYEYENKSNTQETVLGSFITSPVYLKDIHVYQKKNPTDSIETTTVSFLPLQDNGNVKLKALQANNARYGFLTSSNRLLGGVEVKFLGETLRSYPLEYYNDTTFHKDLLRRITHLDNNGTIVSFQEFDYYNDVNLNGNNIFHNDSYSISNINGKEFDNFEFFGTLSDSDHYSKPTGLGGTKIESIGTTLYTGVGWGTTLGKDFTAGASFGYNQSTSEGQMALIDIDGDGLSDMVYKENDGLYYCPQTIVNNTTNFGNKIKIQSNGVSVSNFSRNKSSSITGGIKGYLAILETGADIMSSTSKTTHYFSDVNSDGLVDIVSNGQVLFNHINESGVPTFTASSADTPSPINNNGSIVTNYMTELEESVDSLIYYSPMQDVVRYWEAPFEGRINISSYVNLVQPINADTNSEEYQNRDGVYVSIQIGNSIEWRKQIGKDDFSVHEKHISNYYITKGEKIYFRLQCGNDSTSNGDFDKVNWKTDISYVTSSQEHILDSYGYDICSYSSSDSIFDMGMGMLTVNGNDSVYSEFYKPITTDTLFLEVHYCPIEDIENQLIADEYPLVYSRTFLPTETFDSHINFELPDTCRHGELKFEISSPTNINWSQIQWNPRVIYINHGDSVNDTTTFSVPAIKNIYNRLVFEGLPFTTNVNGAQSCRLNVNANLNSTGVLYAVFRSEDEIFIKRKLIIEDGAIQNDTTFSIAFPKNTTLWLECFVKDNEFADSINNVTLSFPQQPTSGGIIPLVPSAEGYLYSVFRGGDLGVTNRCWGQFIYNGANGRYALPIDENLLHFSKDTTNRDYYNPLTMPFSQFTIDSKDPTRLVGPKPDIFVQCDTMSTARLGDNNVIPLNVFESLNTTFIPDNSNNGRIPGTGARGLTLVTKSKSSDAIAGLSASVVSLSGNVANGESITKNAFMDMNGDGFPDIITDQSIQYTNTIGGYADGNTLVFSLLSPQNPKIEMRSENNSKSFGFGGQYIFSHSKSSNVSIDHSRGASSFSGDSSRNDDRTAFSYLDINGDGLQDMLSVTGNKLCVRLNLGYYFTSPFQLEDIDSIQTSNTGTKSLGVGGNFNYKSSSFAGGAGISSSTSKEKRSFIDINGDGLPDRLYVDSITNLVVVRLNTGIGFDNPTNLIASDAINTTTSSSLSANIASTFNLTLPFNIKIAITPGVNTGKTMSRPRFELRDIDGDGFIDILESDSENEFSVKHSTIARTNKLRTVTNSLGGTFTIDYKHNTPTYGLPGGKWVMSSVDIDYGIHGAYEIPNTKNVFEYYNGRRDRHEREFLGFGQVITKNIDTEHNMSVYRQTVEEYDTCSIYTAGNLLRTYVAKPTGAKLTEVENGYYSYGLTNSVASGVNGGNYKFNEDFQLWNDRGSAYTPLKYTKNMQYEGSVNGTVMSKSWNSYYTRNGEHGLLKDYRYSDKGTLNDDGTGNYDYKTVIDYSNKLTGTNYYFGHPQRVIVRKGIDLYHLTEATYSSAFPSQPTCVKHAVDVKIENPDPDVPVGSGSVGGGSVTNPNILPPTIYTPDTHEDSVSYGALNYAQTNFEYDDYGNLTKVILPEGSDSTRVYYEYLYEDTLSTYIREVDDIFGLNSIDMSHDFRYGITNLTIDQNGARYLVTNDNVGRMSAVRSPNELDADNMTMLFEYNPIAIVDNGVIIKPASATTTYYFRRKYRNNINEETDVKSMKITTFVDGFGRVIETRKESNIKND